MKKQNLLLLLACLSVGVLLNVGCDDSVTEPGPPLANANVHNGIYEVTADNFEELVLNSEQPVLLDFWAEWCGPCVALTPTMEKLASNYDGKIIVGKINVEEQEELALKYEISSIPALLFVKDGEVVKTSVGLQSEEKIQADIDDVVGL